MTTPYAVEECGHHSAGTHARERRPAEFPAAEPRETYPLPAVRWARFRAAVTAFAPAALMAAFLYHPYIVDLTDKAAVAATLAADTTRWGFSHFVIGLGSGLLVLAFVAVRIYLRDAGEERWSILALPFIVLGSTLFTFLPAMEIAMLGAAGAGADVQEVLIAMNPWFVPIMQIGAVLFALGVLGFAMGIIRSGILSPMLSLFVLGALFAMAAARFVPTGAAIYAMGVAGIAALWPLAYVMWQRPTARPAGMSRP